MVVTVDVTDFDEANPSITGPSGEAGDETSSFCRRKCNCGIVRQQMRQLPGH